MGRYIIDERMRQLYEEERAKLTHIPDADLDFIALEIAWKRYFEER
jgi:hypothetical protein